SLSPSLSTLHCSVCDFFFHDTPTTEIYTLSLHDALPISSISTPTGTSFPAPSCQSSSRTIFHAEPTGVASAMCCKACSSRPRPRSEEHTSELQSRENLVCRLLLEKKKRTTRKEEESRVSR